MSKSSSGEDYYVDYYPLEKSYGAFVTGGCLSAKSLKGVDIEKEPVFNSPFFPLPSG
jgi:hypothetical protein